LDPARVAVIGNGLMTLGRRRWSIASGWTSDARPVGNDQALGSGRVSAHEAVQNGDVSIMNQIRASLRVLW
jgi:hypothetical protein